MVGPGKQLGYKPCVKNSDYIIRAEATKRLVDKLIEIKKTANDLDNYKDKNSPFLDVRKDNIYHPYILKAYKEEIVEGYPDETFKPENKITRAEIVVIILKSLYLKEDEYGGIKRDELKYVELPSDSENHWASDYLKYALYVVLIVGYPDGTLKPDSYVTCKEYAWMLKNIEDFYNQNYPKILNLRVNPAKDSLGAKFKIETRIIASENFFNKPKDNTYNLNDVSYVTAKLDCGDYTETINLELEQNKNSKLKLDNFDLVQTCSAEFDSNKLVDYVKTADEITCKITEIELSYYNIKWKIGDPRPSISSIQGKSTNTKVWPVQSEFTITKLGFKEGVVGTEQELYKQYFEDMKKPVSAAMINNNIYISDVDKNCIHKITFDENKKMFKYIDCYKADSSLIPMYKFNSPKGILAYNNYIYVANSGNKEILRCKDNENKFDCTVYGRGFNSIYGVLPEIKNINEILDKKETTFEPTALFVVDTKDGLRDEYYISAIGVRDKNVVVPTTKEGKLAYLLASNTPEFYSAYYTDHGVYFALRKISGNSIVDEKNSGLMKYSFRINEFKELKHEPQITSLKPDDKKDYEDKTKNLEISVYTTKTPIIDFVFYKDYRIVLRRALDDKGKFKDKGYDLALYRRYPDWE
ncbi:MAG: S-layer homology domain-containing protein [Candidatus Woesearchaeota archaeon]